MQYIICMMHSFGMLGDAVLDNSEVVWGSLVFSAPLTTKSTGYFSAKSMRSPSPNSKYGEWSSWYSSLIWLPYTQSISRRISLPRLLDTTNFWVNIVLPSWKEISDTPAFSISDMCTATSCKIDGCNADLHLWGIWPNSCLMIKETFASLSKTAFKLDHSY